MSLFLLSALQPVKFFNSFRDSLSVLAERKVFFSCREGNFSM